MVTTLVIDRGHATLSASGNYITAGKQFKFPDKLHVYEGLENQKYVEALASKAKQAGFKVEFTVRPDDPADPSLFNRVLKANASKNRNNSLFISNNVAFNAVIEAQKYLKKKKNGNK